MKRVSDLPLITIQLTYRTFLPLRTSTTAFCLVTCSAINGATLDLNHPEPKPMIMMATTNRPMIPLRTREHSQHRTSIRQVSHTYSLSMIPGIAQTTRSM